MAAPEPTYLKDEYRRGPPGDGGMDDILARIGRLEDTTSDLKADLSSVKSTVQSLATKEQVGELKALISATETSLIKWVVGTAIACAGLAFAAAKFIH